MLLESFSQTILKWLRIPPGASVRKADGPSTPSSVDLESNDYIQTIMDITVDDICIGDSPLSIDYKPETGRAASVKLNQICDEFNSVIKDVARDLCKDGYSILDLIVDKETNRLIAMPYIELVEFYITATKKVVVYEKDSDNQLMHKLIFINYNKRSLQKVEEHSLSADKAGVKFKVTPEPMQMKNAAKTLEGIVNAETAIAKYRGLLRPVRYANVDIGTAQGDKQKDTIDSIASAINCNSESLGNGTTYTDFDDNIPVLPNRKGLGKLEISSDIPSADIKDLSDLEYWINKLNLLMRFPGTYMDFSKALSESAVSMIRGDLRYTKLCKAIQTKIVNTLNSYIQDSKFSKYKPVFSLTMLPSSEDDDVMQALDSYCDLADKVESFIIGESEDSKEIRMHRLTLLKDLFATSTTSPMLQKWFDDFEIYITSATLEENQEFEGSEDLGDKGFSEDLGGDEFNESSGDLDFNDLPDESEDVEILEPQS